MMIGTASQLRNVTVMFPMPMPVSKSTARLVPTMRYATVPSDWCGS